MILYKINNCNSIFDNILRQMIEINTTYFGPIILLYPWRGIFIFLLHPGREQHVFEGTTGLVTTI